MGQIDLNAGLMGYSSNHSLNIGITELLESMKKADQKTKEIILKEGNNSPLKQTLTDKQKYLRGLMRGRR